MGLNFAFMPRLARLFEQGDISYVWDVAFFESGPGSFRRVALTCVSPGLSQGVPGPLKNNG